jgi:phosphopantothenoylcysteine decarboxylase/phosphopantothenate--cysteine ligase
VETAEQMRTAVLSHLDEATMVIATAAVSDYRPKTPAERKLKRTARPMQIEMEPTPDILAEVVQRKTRQLVIGFAAETENVLENARAKLAKKSVDMIVVNDVSRDGIGFDSERNAVNILTEDDMREIPEASKLEVAQRILDEIVRVRQRRADAISSSLRAAR